MKRSIPSSLAFIGLGLLIPAVAAEVASRAAGRGFEALTSKPLPKDAASPKVSWRRAIAWTILSSAIGGLASVITRKGLVVAGLPAGRSLGEELRTLFKRR